MSVEDALTRKQVLNQRFASSLAIKYGKEIAALYARIAARMVREPNQVRLARIADDLNRILNLGFREMSQEINQDVLDFAVDESEFAVGVFNNNSQVPFRIPDLPAIQRALANNALSVPVGPSDLTMQEALEQFAEARTLEIRQVITDSALLGETVPETAKKIRSIATKRPKQQVDALVRTLTNHAASQARKVVVDAHKNLFQGEEWVATLDSRTTLICGGRDGTIYPVGKGPYPPAHWNCRSLRTPVLKEEFQSVSQAARRKSDGDKKKTLSGRTGFDGWLRSQSAGFQDEYFSQFPDGLEKAKLFRLGDLEIQRFRDETGRNYTLEQLRALNPIAFQDANIEI